VLSSSPAKSTPTTSSSPALNRPTAATPLKNQTNEELDAAYVFSILRFSERFLSQAHRLAGLNGGKKAKAYDTLRKHTKRVRRQLSGEKAPSDSANPFQVKAFAAQFELQAAKQKQTELKSKMEDLAQQANSQTIELDKAKEKIRLMEEALFVFL
jgi:hypothetical protein